MGWRSRFPAMQWTNFRVVPMVSMSISFGYQYPMFRRQSENARPTTMLIRLSRPGPNADLRV